MWSRAECCVNMDPVERCRELARRRGLTIVLPEGEDARVVTAARRLRDEAIAAPILLGAPEAVAAAARGAGLNLDGIAVVDPGSDPRAPSYAAACAAARETMSDGMAARLVARPLYFAGMMVRQG